MKTVIRNAKIVTPKKITLPSTVWIENGQIQQIDSQNQSTISDEYQIIDAKN